MKRTKNGKREEKVIMSDGNPIGQSLVSKLTVFVHQE